MSPSSFALHRTWLLATLLISMSLIETKAIVLLPPPLTKFSINSTYTSPACQAKYSCSLQTGDVQECSCHPYCYLFDSCCADRRQQNWATLAQPQNMHTCASAFDATGGSYYSIENNDFVSLINNCPSGYDNSELLILCQHPVGQWNEGTESIPVTDPLTGLIYRNIYCAFCNGKTSADVVTWVASYYCHGGASQRMTVSASTDNSECNIAYFPPALDVKNPDCRLNIISSCPQDAPADVAAACSSGPTAYVYNQQQKIVYRNLYCALCYESPSAPLSCTIWSPIESVGTGFTTFTLPAVINPSDQCPSFLTSVMSHQEQAAWRSICPGIRFASKCVKRRR